MTGDDADEFERAIAAEIVAMTKQLKLSQRVIADGTGRAPSTISDRMTSKASWDLRDIAAIAKVFDMDPWELVANAKYRTY